ncbi:MAG: transcription elongation factor GreA [Mycoplasmataceae bacterium]|nr:transcription elongation factor GreA [Mycoplasmataceae bacterium]
MESKENLIVSGNESIKITKEGKKNYEERLNYLLNEGRKEVQKDLQNAREQGDLSENAEYDAAKEKQAEIESEIEKIQDIISRAKIIKASDVSATTAGVGSVVEFKNSKGKNETIEIVSSIETDPFTIPLKLSNNSPLVKAIIGKKSGDIVTVDVEKPYKIEILSVKRSE